MLEKMKFETPNLTNENKAKIAALFPGVVADGKVNFDLLRSMLGEDVFADEAYEFTWVGKRAAIAEAGKPIRKTLRPSPEESKDWDTTENLYIEGDNLEVLKLLQESYLGKVKIIYIDPPYNTGNDFVYRDNYTKAREEYEEDAGIYSEMGDRLFKNSESNGRFHSDWCSMIYPRLVLARNLLREDGVIFISIDDNELATLIKICDEVFGASNFVNQIAWVNNLTGRQISGFGAVKTYEYILVYAKNSASLSGFTVPITTAKELMPDTYKGFNKDIRNDEYGEFAVGDTLYNHNRIFNEETRPNLVFSIFYNPQNGEIIPGDIGENKKGYVELLPHKNGDGTHKYHAWRWSRNKIINESHDLIVLPTSNGGYEIYTKIRSFANTALKDLITNISNGDTEFKNLFDGKKYFDYPKSTDLLKVLLGSIPESNDSLILDFFSGSSTTAHGVLRLNAEDKGKRKFIMIQLPEETGIKSEANKAGLKNICEIGKERIRRAGDKIKDEAGLTGQGLDIGFRVLKLDDTNMNDVYYAAGDYTQNMISMLESNIKEDRTDMDLLFGCLLDWGLPLSLPHTHEKIEGFTVHTYNEGDLIACFEERISENVVREIAKRQPLRVVFRDSSFTSSPEKINVVEIFKLLAPNTTVRVI
ncbi:site-specific DNA-methyltransferase [Acetobacterium wieringae]|uniref:Site-specific DNA-methyltransferase n=1 Tax=Acetobacterium wieringae TaxID=52694 RepID=A0A5D0WJY9_9FIRM|nr:site-specific DNA-methyltransferase [Acetobacterium wieringae]TYC84364.1 site-specific DNA-methyltransferase [Acetobacterium wieringae]